MVHVNHKAGWRAEGAPHPSVPVGVRLHRAALQTTSNSSEPRAALLPR